MKLYNSLTQRKEPFYVRDNTVTIYVCGITPYDTTHLGHAFTYVTFDVLIRHLESKGYNVRYTQNVTDIDDDILRKAEEVGKPWDELGTEQTEAFVRDLKDLNVEMPDYFPRATEVIPFILNMSEELLKKGYAYERNGSVYYRVHADPDFGTLSRLDYETMLATANERGNYPDDPNKDDPLDFVLWQAAKPGEPSWDSPWGQGRPGWHIECSAMSLKFLGPTIDIHGGGSDLLFPHHECEIAQSEKFTGQRPFVRFWMHIAMLHESGEKMSKSLGNLVLMRNLLDEGFTSDAIRINLIRHHYRDAWEWSRAEQEESQEWADTLKEAATLAPRTAGTTLNATQHRRRFMLAMDDDLDTPAALAELRNLAAAIQSAHGDGKDVRDSQDELRALGHILGLRLGDETV